MQRAIYWALFLSALSSAGDTRANTKFTTTIADATGQFTLREMQFYRMSATFDKLVDDFRATLVNGTERSWSGLSFRVVASGVDPSTGRRAERVHEITYAGEVAAGAYVTLHQDRDRTAYLVIDRISAERIGGQRGPSRADLKAAEAARVAAELELKRQQALEREERARQAEERARQAEEERDARRRKRTAPHRAYLTQLPRGRWRVERSKSGFDDSPTVVLSLSATRPVRGWLRPSIVPVLIARCKEGKTVFYVALDVSPQPESEGITVRYRWMKRPLAR